MSNWPQVKFREFVDHRKEFIQIDDLKEYKRARVQLHWKGIVERDRIQGAAIKTKKQQVARDGELLVAEIDAKVGGIGIVPPEIDRALVSSHYFLFDIDEALCLRSWLDYYVRSGALEQQVAARGSTNYAAIRPGHVLDFEMPLPPLPEQKRIVAKIEELSAKITEARGLRQRASNELDAMLSAALASAFSSSPESVSLGSVCEVIDPNPSHRYPVYLQDGVPIISSSEFQGAEGIDWSSARRVSADFYQETLGRFGVGEGDVIFSRKGKVGYARLHPPGVQLAMTHTLCVLKPDRSRVAPRFLLLFAKSVPYLDELTRTMNPNVGVPTLGLKVIRDATFPLPSLPEQRRIVKFLDNLQAKVDGVQKLQDETQRELDAMMPSILFRAFSGNL